MPDLTPNLQLKKPLDNETADIAIINENMDKIDAGFKAVADELDAHQTDLAKHGIYTDTTTNKKYQLGVLNGLLYYKEVI